jgi:hypothetical protein
MSRSPQKDDVRLAHLIADCLVGTCTGKRTFGPRCTIIFYFQSVERHVLVMLKIWANKRESMLLRKFQIKAVQT